MQHARMTATYTPGDLVELRAHFFDDGCSPVDVDPDQVTIRIKDPNGSVQAFVSGSDAQVVLESPGHYRCDVDTSSGPSGTWLYRWEGVGGFQAAAEGSFKVSESGFAESP